MGEGACPQGQGGGRGATQADEEGVFLVGYGGLGGGLVGIQGLSPGEKEGGAQQRGWC